MLPQLIGLLAILCSALAASNSGLPNLSTITNTAASSAAGSAKSSAATTNTANPTITNTGVVASTNTQVVPSISGTTAAGAGGITDAPKLTGVVQYPAASVPPTAGAPFMQASSLPQGTVFIIVGAVLGFMAITVLAWRGMTAWSLHRAVQRAATQDMSDVKASFRTASIPMYNYKDNDSTAMLPAPGRKVRKNKVSNSRPSTSAAQSLFFSPTAGAVGAHLTGNRASTYLAPGYYAAGASAPGAGNGTSHIGSGLRESINMSTLAPQIQGYAKTRNDEPSPPESPEQPSRYSRRDKRSSRTNTEDYSRQRERPPTVFLDDAPDSSGSARRQERRKR